MQRILAVIPLYNKEQTIERAIKAVNSQTQSLDLLVVNDGSTDGSNTILENYKSNTFQVLTQKNAGVSAARNAGITYAIENDYTHVAFLDADDYWKPDHIKNISLLQASFPIAQVLATGYKILQFSKKPKKAVHTDLTSLDAQLLDNYFEYNYLNTILTSSNCCFDVRAFEKIGLFNTAFTHGEDTDLFIRAGARCNIAFEPRSSVVIDRTSSNRSATTSIHKRKLLDLDAYEAISQTVPGLKKYLDLNRFSLSLAYRLEHDIKNAAVYKQKLDSHNLSKKQNKLLEMSTTQLKALKRTQKILGKLGWYLRTGN